LCNLIHYWSSHHGYRYSTRSIRDHTAVEVVGENETPGYADNNYSTLAGRDYHDCPDYWDHLHSFDTFTPVSLPHRRWTLHHSSRILLDVYDRSDKTTTLGRAGGQGRRTRKDDWLDGEGKTERDYSQAGQVIARKPTRASSRRQLVPRRRRRLRVVRRCLLLQSTRVGLFLRVVL